MNYFENLKNKVLQMSNEKHIFNDACEEWDIINQYEDEGSTCECGKEDITICHRLVNRLNGNVLDPIGSVCIKKFGNERLSRRVDELLNIRSVLKYVMTSLMNNSSPSHSKRSLMYVWRMIDEYYMKVGDPWKNSDFIHRMIGKRTWTKKQRERWDRIWLWDLKNVFLTNKK